MKKIEFTDWITPNEALAAGGHRCEPVPAHSLPERRHQGEGLQTGADRGHHGDADGVVFAQGDFPDQVPARATVAIANDPVNGARGLQLFEKAGLITLKPEVGDDATVEDITANPKHLRFIQLEAAQLPRALDDVAVAQVSLSYLVMSGGDPATALASDGAGNPHYALNSSFGRIGRTTRGSCASSRSTAHPR